MKITQLFKEFYKSEKAGGIVLVLCTILSLLLANVFFPHSYPELWHQKIAGLSIEHWINDGLMAIFFLLVGLELERELYNGELSNIKNALLPIISAIGGMIVPAFIYFMFNMSHETKRGFGIPMATDIAFAIAILALIGNRVPASLRVFLTALAIIDDIGAIIVIALFYSKSLSMLYLLGVFVIMVILFILNRLKVNAYLPYIIGGVGMWYCMLQSGVHATLSGILLAFVLPFGDGSKNTISYKVQHLLHYPVAFIILPIFALANTAIFIHIENLHVLSSSLSLGIVAGLLLGKPIGIFGFSFLADKLKLAAIPNDINWLQFLGLSVLGGIGFTMSIFIALLAFENQDYIEEAKIAIMLSSAISAIIGYLIVYFTTKSSVILED